MKKEFGKEALKVVRITDGEARVLDTVSSWIYSWWGREQGFSQQQIREHYRHAVCENRPPQTFVAYIDDEPVGTFQFGMEDSYVRPELYPWIKNVYVPEELRGRGYGETMLETVGDFVSDTDIEQLYLFTHMTGFYEKHGWRFIEEFETYKPTLGRQRLYIRKF